MVEIGFLWIYCTKWTAILCPFGPKGGALSGLLRSRERISIPIKI